MSTKGPGAGAVGRIANRVALLLPLLLLLASTNAQKPTPAPAQTKSILLKGGTVHVGDAVVAE